MTGSIGIKQSLPRTTNIYPPDSIRKRTCFYSFHNKPLPSPNSHKRPDLYGNGFKAELQFQKTHIKGNLKVKKCFGRKPPMKLKWNFSCICGFLEDRILANGSQSLSWNWMPNIKHGLVYSFVFYSVQYTKTKSICFNKVTSIIM